MTTTARRFFTLVVVLTGTLALVGCGPDRPDTVPVTGRVTLAGGDWPVKGIIIFTPVEATAGYPKRPGRAIFDLEGNFVVTTFTEGDGLIPGTYRAVIQCGQPVTDMETPTVSYVPSNYESPALSGLELTVPANSSPIEVEYDIAVAQ